MDREKKERDDRHSRPHLPWRTAALLTVETITVNAKATARMAETRCILDIPLCDTSNYAYDSRPQEEGSREHGFISPREAAYRNPGPRGFGRNLIAYLTIMTLVSQAFAFQPQICGFQDGGNVFVPPPILPCEEPQTQIIFTKADLYEVRSDPMKQIAHACYKNAFQVKTCVFVLFDNYKLRYKSLESYSIILGSSLDRSL
uniref:Secreted protein n=1 Tax=Caenorhabditis tropicalis TaxID=1561998 RepID=A0A1I7TT82_9PELO